MIDHVNTAKSSKPPSKADGMKARIMGKTQEQAAYKIQKQLEALLSIANDNQLEMLSYLIEMALLEAAGKAKRGLSFKPVSSSE